MADKGIYLKLEVDDKGTPVIKGVDAAYAKAMQNIRSSTDLASRVSDQFKSKLSGLAGSIFNLRNAVIGFAGATGAGALAKSFLSAASESENLATRLKVLLGSQAEGARLFKEMADYAGRVPFQFQEVMSSATALSGVMKGGVDQIKQWMPMIGDLAAASGIGLQETTTQVIRMYSAGAAAADLFRERGVLAMLGFTAGVEYSAEETRKKLMDAWSGTASQFKGATDALASTWTGTMSMFGDMWFKFRTKVMETDVFAFLKMGAQDALKTLQQFEKDGTLDKWAEQLAETVLGAFEVILVNAAKWADTLKPIISSIWDFLAQAYQGFMRMPGWIQDIGLVAAYFVGKKGAVVLGGITYVIEGVMRSIDSFKMVTAGKTGFWDWVLMDKEEGAKAMADFEGYLKRSEAEIDRLGAAGIISGEEVKKLKEELKALGGGSNEAADELKKLSAAGGFTGQIAKYLLEANAKLDEYREKVKAAKDEQATYRPPQVSGTAAPAALTEDQKKALEDYKKASLDIDKEIYASSHTLYQAKLNDIELEINAYREAGIEKDRLDQLRLVKQEELNRERVELEREMQLELRQAELGDEGKATYELEEYKAQLAEKVEAARQAGVEEVALRDYVNRMTLAKEKEQSQARIDLEREIQLEIIDAIGSEQEKAYAHFVADLQDRVKEMKAAGMQQVEIQQYVNAKIAEEQKKTTEQLAQYWEDMVTGIKASMSDTFAAMFRGEGEEIEAIWDELWTKLQKSYADMVTEQFSGLISDILQSEAVGGLLDTMGLGGFAKAWEETSTPPSLKVLDEQYDLQNEQHKTQQAILEALGGNVTGGNLDLDGIFGSGGKFDFGKIFDEIKGIFSETKTEQPITQILDYTPIDQGETTDFSALTDEVNMCSEATGGFATAAEDAAYTADTTTSALSNFGTKLKGFFGAGGIGGSALGMIGGGFQVASAWNEGNYKGDSRWSGAAKGAVAGGLGGFGVGLGIQSLGLLMGVAGPWGLALGAIIGAVGGFLGGQTAEKMEKELARAEDYMDEFKEIAGATYDSLTDMMLAFDETLQAKNIYAMQWLDMITARQAQVLYAFAEAATVAQNEVKATASVSAGTFERMTLQLERAREQMPDFAEDIGKIQTQMEKLYKADILDDFATGVLRAQSAVEALVRTGMSQLAAQTELFGESYNEILLLMNGSIPVIDSTDESFNDLREEMAELQASIDELPDSVSRLKDALNDVMYAANYLINATQSVVNFTESFVELPDIFARIKNAEDFEDIAQSLQELENICAEAIGMFSQLADIYDYLGAKKLANVFTGFAEGAGYLTALVTVIRMVVEAFTHWDDIQIAVLKIWRNFLVALDKSPLLDLSKAIEYIDLQIERLGGSWEDMMDMFVVWQKQLDDMDVSQLFDELIDKTKEWQEILYRTKFGSIKADMYDLLKDFTFALMTIKELQERAQETNDMKLLDTANKMETQLREAFVEKVEEYFDAIIEKFEDLGDTIRASIYSIEKDYAKLMSDMAKTPAEALAASELTATMYRRMFDDVSTRLTTAQSDLAALSPVEDPDEYLEKAQDVRDLIMERYDLEMERIQELIDEQENIKDAYEGVVDTVEDALRKLKGEGANPKTARQRLGFYETEAQSLREKIASAKTPEEAAGYQSDLVALLQDYLGVAEDAYQRPSAAYKAIYDKVIGEITAIGTDAQTKVSAAEKEIIRLQGEQKTLMEQTWTQLVDINGKIETAKSALESTKETYKQIINDSDVGAIADWFAQNSLPSLTKVEDNTGATASSAAETAQHTKDTYELFKAKFPLAAAIAENRQNRANVQTTRAPLPSEEETPEMNVTVTPPDVTIDEVKVIVPQPKVTVSSVKVEVPQPKITVSQLKVTVPQPRVTVRSVINQVKINVPQPKVTIAQVKVSVPAPVIRIALVKVTVPALKVEMPAAAFKALSTGITAINTTIKTTTNGYLRDLKGFQDELNNLKKLPGIDTELNMITAKLTTINASIKAIKLNPVINVESASGGSDMTGTNGLLGSIYNRIGDMSSKVFGVPLATGIEYVPKDNYMARLHKGEAVLTAAENNDRKKGSGSTTNTFNFSVNIQGGGDAKSISEALKKDIKYGTLGMIIEERVRAAS